MPTPPTLRLLLLLASALAAAACRDQGPVKKGPPYLAILPLVALEEGASGPRAVHYRVQMLSEPVTVDTVITRGATDTVILSLPPATYGVTLDGLPGWCTSRNGTEREALLLRTSNTSIVRYALSCRVALTVRTSSQGQPPGTRYALRVSRGAEVVRDVVMAANDSLKLDGLAAGTYALDLRNVPDACAIVNDAGRVPKVTVPATGGAEMVLRVDCARPTDRPQVTNFAASYHDGTLGYYAEVTDPNRDVNQYVVNLTDCDGASLLPRGARTFTGLARTAIGPDTVFVIAAFEAGVPDSLARTACASFRAVDLAGNTSAAYEVPLTGDTTLAPRVLRFNSLFSGTSAITSILAVDDPDGDYAGAFLAFYLRDGALGNTVDGKPEYGIYAVNGVRGSTLPVIPLGSPYPDYADYLSVVVYVVDKRGRFRRVVDTDLQR
jgi:hypothetical protein